MIRKDVNVTPNTCGDCINDQTCNIQIKKTSGFGEKSNYGPFSNCKYYVKFSLKPAEKSTKNKPCTNRPVKCERCDTILWSYNIEAHYRLNHDGHEIPNMISEEEIRRLNNVTL